MYYRDQLTAYGAAEVYYIPVTVDSKGNNSNSEVVQNVQRMSGFFFGGGDQLRIIYSFFNNDEKEPSEVLRAIKQTLLRTGGVVAGTSAGTDCQTGNTMISGGESYEGVVDGTEFFWRTIERKNPNTLTAYGPGGLNLFTYGHLDTHFANRGRHGRLVQLLVDSASYSHGTNRAFGVDENTALVITGDWSQRRGSVIGQRGVWMFDSSYSTTTASTVTTDGESTNSVKGIIFSRLSVNDVLDFNTFQVYPANYKKVMSDDKSVETSSNIFGADVFEMDRILTSLLLSQSNSTYGTSAETSPTVKVYLNKLSPSHGYEGVNPSTGLSAYTAVNFAMSMFLE